MTRPPPPERDAPAGHRWEPGAEDPDDWRVPAAGEQRLCRTAECRKAAELVMLRQALSRPVGRPSRRWRVAWGYCAAHAFGRWVEGGTVYSWRLVELRPHLA